MAVSSKEGPEFGHIVDRNVTIPSGHADQASVCVRTGVQINNGVYRSGFATTQGAYERAQADLYAALDAVERRLGAHRFLVGDRFVI